MRSNAILIILGVTIVAVMGILGLTLVLAPENEPAFDNAVTFMNAVGDNDDATAFALLTEELQTYVTENCPDSSVSTCINDYIPDEWGDLLAPVYRRSIPIGDTAWDVQLVATYEEGQGFAGVCIYHRMEEVAPDDWRVAAWSGFISCDDRNSGMNALRREDAINRVP